MAFLDFLFGSKPKNQLVSRFTPQQQQLQSSLAGGVSSALPSGFEYLASLLGGSPQSFSAIEKPAMRQFEQQILPSIAERFTGSFGPGSQRSSAFGQQLGAAGSSLAEHLSAQRLQAQQNALSTLIALLSASLSPEGQIAQTPATTGLLPVLGGGAAQAFGGGLGRAGLSALLGGLI